MLKTSIFVCSLLLGALAVSINVAPVRAQAKAGPLAVVAKGKSVYTIVRAPGATQSAQVAATELQQYFRKSTGAQLPLLTNDQTPTTPFISIGDTAAARAAGISIKGMPWESYRIVTRGPNVFILGPDTPDKAKAPQGGTSHGTAFGVYTFTEDYLGVRWLMPGVMGEDVPPHDSIILPADLDRMEAPVFESRVVTGLQNTPEAMLWKLHQKLGYSLLSVHDHNWVGVITPDLYEAHPEWFAEVDGKRMRPIHTRYKIETTNPELVKYFAEQIKKAFRADPNRYMFSMSPEDNSGHIGASWSQSRETMALMEKDPNGNDSRTKLILSFYNAVAREVAKEFPDRRVAGYIYSSYTYPPKDGVGPLEPNLFLTIAMGMDYGYKGFRPSVQPKVANLVKAWAHETSNITYYDLPTWVRFNSATITPPAPQLTNFLFSLMQETKVKGSYMYGTGEWSQGAPNNYVLARQSWNPSLDANAIASEFYQRAYGAEAGVYMQQLYKMVEQSVEKYITNNKSVPSVALPIFMEQVIAANYPEIERLYGAAQTAAANATPGQKARLNFFGDNLILTNARLRKLKAIPTDTTSPFYRTPEQIEAMVGKIDPNFGVKLGDNYDPDVDENHRPPSAKSGLLVPKTTIATPETKTGLVNTDD